MQLTKISLIIILILGISSKTFAQELTMFSSFGYQFYQDDRQISKLEFETLLLENAAANTAWLESKKEIRTALVFMGIEVGFLVWGVASVGRSTSKIVPVATLIGVLGSATVSAAFSLFAHRSKRDAILKYNNGLESNTSIDIGLQKNGLGFGLNF